MVCVSPLVLGPLAEGFFPLAWVGVITVSVAAATLSPQLGFAPYVALSSLGVVMTAATYPPMAPVVALLALGARVARLRLVPAIAAAGASMLALGLVLRQLAGSATVVSSLSLPGAWLHYSAWLLLVLLVVGLLNYLSIGTSDQRNLLVALVLAVMGLAIMLAWLESLSETGATAYYTSKTLVAGFSALLPLALGTAVNASRAVEGHGHWRRLMWPTAAALALFITTVPILFASAPKLPLLKIARGWFLPTVGQAGLIFEIRGDDATAVEWATYDPESDRRINIWLGSGRVASGERNLGDEGYSWAYGADMSGLAGYCDLLRRRPEMDVFVDTAAQRDMVEASCAVQADRVHVIGAP